MIRLKCTFLFFLFFLLLHHQKGQSTPIFHPLNGFHFGITGQAEFISRSTFILFEGKEPVPQGVMTYGWDAGIEFSYHFAKYFGISIGMNVGTVLTYNCDIYLGKVPDFQGGWKEINKYERLGLSLHEIGSQFPIKIEFHYPLRRNIFFTAETGVKIKGIFNRIEYGKNQIGKYSYSLSYLTYPPYTHDDSYEETDIFLLNGYRNISKIRCDLLVGLGIYYKLPFGDLLRFVAGINLSFNPDLIGEYVYCIPVSYGNFLVKNDFIYTQLSYIHTLNWKKAKKYLKKNDVTFCSKKERRKKIIEMLNVL